MSGERLPVEQPELIEAPGPELEPDDAALRLLEGGDSADPPAELPDAEEVTEPDEGSAGEDEAGRGPNLFRIYYREVGRVSLLNAKQEVDLAKRVEAGLFAEEALEMGRLAVAGVAVTKAELLAIAADGTRAKDDLLEANLRLVVSLAKRYTGQGVLFLDLIQEGNLGLIRAVEKFDYTKGYKFSTYATWWIRQTVTRAIADQARTIRVPSHAVEQINKLARVERAMYQSLGREPTPEELSAELDMTPERIMELRRHDRDPTSLYRPVGEDGDAELVDFVEDGDLPETPEIVSHGELGRVLWEVLDTLSEREATTIIMRFGLLDGDPKSLETVGKVLGVGRERVRQIERRTLAKLRHPSRGGLLRDFLG